MCENILFYNVVQNCSHFFQLLFFILKRGRKKNIFFSSQNILDEFFCVLFVFVFLRFFFVVFIFFLVATNTQQIKVCVAFFLYIIWSLKKSNQAKNSLITIVTSKHLKNVQAELTINSSEEWLKFQWNQFHENFRQIDFTEKNGQFRLHIFFYINTYW